MSKLLPPALLLGWGLVAVHAAGPATPSKVSLVSDAVGTAASADSQEWPLSSGGTLMLPRRDRTGRAREGEPPATVSLAVSGDDATFTVRAPRMSGESAAANPLDLALIFWNQGEPPLAPPTVLFAKNLQGGATTFHGRVLATAAQGGPRFLRSAGVWPALGVSAKAAWDAQSSVVTVSFPLGTLAEIAPGGLLFDVRVLEGEALYSFGPAANWPEPPDPNRAASVPLGVAGGAPGRLAALAASAGVRPTQPGPQLWALSRALLPLEMDSCEACADPEHLHGNIGQAEADARIDANFALLEADGAPEAAIVSALRSLAKGLSKARIHLADSAGAELRLRLLKAIQDDNTRAAYGADLLLLHDMVPEARSLLQAVLANEAAPAAVKVHALFRMAQLSAASADWPAALSLAEQIADVAPFDTALRQASLDLLAPGAEEADSTDFDIRLDALRSGLSAARTAICFRFFDAAVASSAAAFCPESASQQR